MSGVDRSGMVVLRHAVENASDELITDDGIIAILSGADGNGSHMRAIFGDASLHAIADAGASRGVPFATILAAYAAARATAAVANPEMDAALNDGW